MPEVQAKKSRAGLVHLYDRDGVLLGRRPMTDQERARLAAHEARTHGPAWNVGYLSEDDMPKGIVDKPQLPNQPKWSWWQRALGWLRRALNVGRDAGVLPKKGQGPRF